MVAKDCPMCGEAMRQREREIVDRVPGTHQASAAKYREWVCPECDYFEEVEESEE
jgi:hypothetical protein